MKLKKITILKGLAHAIALAMLLMGYILFTDAFLGAYRSPTKTVVVDINYYGEAKAELWLLILSAPLIFCSLGWMIRAVITDIVKNE